MRCKTGPVHAPSACTTRQRIIGVMVANAGVQLSPNDGEGRQ